MERPTRLRADDTTGSAVALDVALDNAGGDRTLLAELVGLFCDDTPRTLRALDAAVHAGDADAVRHAAHTLKGSAGVFGAARAVERARELETLARDHRLEEVPALAAALRSELERVVSALRASVARTEAP